MTLQFPTTYEAWRHCIEIDCKEPLTPAFIERRLRALQDPRDFHTEQFDRRWGSAHRAQVIAWFERARDASNH